MSFSCALTDVKRYHEDNFTFSLHMQRSDFKGLRSWTKPWVTNFEFGAIFNLSLLQRISEILFVF